MEAFIVASVFVAALFLGAETREVAPEPPAESEPVSASARVDARAHSVPVCDRDGHRIIQRDLSVPVDLQGNENGH